MIIVARNACFLKRLRGISLASFSGQGGSAKKQARPRGFPPSLAKLRRTGYTYFQASHYNKTEKHTGRGILCGSALQTSSHSMAC